MKAIGMKWLSHINLSLSTSIAVTALVSANPQPPMHEPEVSDFAAAATLETQEGIGL